MLILFGYKVDLEARPGGDSGIDFKTEIGTIDVKTARKAYNLIVEVGKEDCANIFVLAKYDDETKTAELLGWAYSEEIKKAPVRNFGYGIINHYIPIRKLHSIDKLFESIKENEKI